MPRFLSAVLLFVCGPALAGRPAEAGPTPQYVPPVLKGVKGEGSGRHALKPIPFPDANENWILASSKHFVFVSSARERKTRDIAEGLERLAEYFSNAELRSGSIRAGSPIPAHVQTLQLHHRIPLQKLFAVATESDLYNEPDSQRAFYAESWALVQWLIRTNSAAFYEFLHDVEQGKPVEEALRARYDRSLDDMQRAFDVPRNEMTYGTTLPVPNADTSV